MGVIRRLPGGAGHIQKKPGTGQAKSVVKPDAQKPIAQSKGPSESVQIQSTPVAEAPQKAESPSKPEAKSVSQPETPRAEVPTTLLQETPEKSQAEDSSTTNWVLESAAQTPYANDPSLAIVKKRFGTLNEAVTKTLTEPLLDAITVDDPEKAKAKLKDLAATATWAQKFKKDGVRLAAEGDYPAMLQKAKELESKKSGPKTLLDEIRGGDSLTFDTKLPTARAKEADQLLQQFQNGNENPGIGTKALGKGISYLRGRKGTRLFFKKQGDKVEWLAVCDKTNEPQAIKKLQKEYNLS